MKKRKKKRNNKKKRTPSPPWGGWPSPFFVKGVASRSGVAQNPSKQI